LADTFLQRFLQHVLPKGFAKVRSYGLLAPGNRQRLRQAKRLLGQEAQARREPQTTNQDGGENVKAIACPHCGRPMTVMQLIQLRACCPP
jgi:hypothetical protein